MTDDKKAPSEPMPLSDEVLAEVAGGHEWTAKLERSYRKVYEYQFKAGMTDAKTFDEFVAKTPSIAAYRDTWLMYGRPGWQSWMDDYHG